MPLTLDEYQIGQLFSVIEASRENTNGDTGVEIVANEPFDNERGRGQYTQKIYYLGSFMPSLVTALLPANSRYVIEKAWNVFPHCRTEMHHNLLKDRFSVVIESKHLPDAGTTENTFGLTREELENRKIIWIDIAADKLKENRSDLDPTTFKSAKTQRGNLQGKWWETHTPIMCCYKLVTVKFQVFGFQTKVEDYIMKFQRDILIKFHKSVFCWIDRWHGLTLDDVRILEDQVRRELDAKINELGMGIKAASKNAGSVKSTPY